MIQESERRKKEEQAKEETSVAKESKNTEGEEGDKEETTPVGEQDGEKTPTMGGGSGNYERVDESTITRQTKPEQVSTEDISHR